MSASVSGPFLARYLCPMVFMVKLLQIKLNKINTHDPKKSVFGVPPIKALRFVCSIHSFLLASCLALPSQLPMCSAACLLASRVGVGFDVVLSSGLVSETTHTPNESRLYNLQEAAQPQPQHRRMGIVRKLSKRSPPNLVKGLRARSKARKVGMNEMKNSWKMG